MPRKKKSATRRGNNEGSIYQRKDGLWIAQVTIGVKEDGKIARKSFTGMIWFFIFRTQDSKVRGDTVVIL